MERKGRRRILATDGPCRTGLSDKRVEGAGHLHLEAVLILASFPSTPAQRKELEKGRFAFIQTEGSNTLNPSPTQRGWAGRRQLVKG